MKNRTFLTILSGIGGFAIAFLILAGGSALIHGGVFADGFRNFWDWAIAIMAGISCARAYWYNAEKKKEKKHQDKDE